MISGRQSLALEVERLACEAGLDEVVKVAGILHCAHAASFEQNHLSS
jgi:hypothetical protein